MSLNKKVTYVFTGVYLFQNQYKTEEELHVASFLLIKRV